MNRDKCIDVLRGIGIIFVVVGHSGCPNGLCKLIYMSHMPLFFIASGYFLSDAKLDLTTNFLTNKIKNLYFPFLFYSLLFLFFHNYFFDLGIIDTTLGGGKYDAEMFAKELLLRVFLMEVHTEQLLGSFWFIQVLFFANIVYIFVHNKICPNKTYRNLFIIVYGTSIIAITTLHLFFPIIKTILIYRLLVALLFLHVGYLFKTHNVLSKITIIIFFLLSCVYAILFCLWPASMAEQSSMIDFISIVISGSVGFILLYKISALLDKTCRLIPKALSFLGERSFYIMMFHFLCFKIINLFICLYYNLDSSFIGSHPCISIGHSWWILYTTIGVIGSLLLSQIVLRIKYLATQKTRILINIKQKKQ